MHAAVRGALAAALFGAAALHPTLPGASAAAVEDPSDIVIVLDFSGSILDDAAVRGAFADAIDGIAGRVEETTATLTAGDATVSIVRFATRAADVPDCAGIALRNSEAAVGRLAGCLRTVATSYRAGVSQELIAQIGDDTNYVAALEAAATHLPADSARPAIIFFTDGRHEADGVPVAAVVPARDRLFGERSPFALLPVGMGIDPANRPQLEAGLANLRITRQFERCDGGALDWPAVVFDTAEAAGRAVAVALQDVSCTFTVEPSGPPASPTTPPLATVQGVFVIPGNEQLEIGWGPPRDVELNPVEDYLVRCRPADGDDGDWIESSEGISTDTGTTIEGLANGTEYHCEVAAVRASGADDWTAASRPASPFGRPEPPPKPSVQAGDAAARITVEPPAGPVDGYRFECSADGGASWAFRREAAASERSLEIGGLTNGTEYVCRVFAANTSGESDASALSDAFRPCGGFLQCNPAAVPVLGAAGAALAFVVFIGLWRWYAGRRLYVTAEVDRFVSVDLGRGPNVGLALVRRGPYQRVARVEPAKGRDVDIQVRYTGGERFIVTSAGRRYAAEVGRPVRVPDATGELHDLVLRVFDEKPQPLRRAEDDAPA